MKFADIPKFTRPGNYQINIPISYLKNVLEDYKKDFGLQMNPDFQRGNVWSEEQQIAYVEYFLRGGRSSRIIYFNHPDFAGFANKDTDIPYMVLVDGLQRLTAMLRFLDNEIPAFGCYFKDFEDTPRKIDYDFIFNVNNLQYRRDVLQWYIDMNSGGTVHSHEEITRVRKLLEAETKAKPKEVER